MAPTAAGQGLPRRRRPSGDIITRPPTYGSGLNELDSMIAELDENGEVKPGPEVSQPAGGLVSSALTAVLVVILAALVRLVGWRPVRCEDTCAYAGDGVCDDGHQACEYGGDCGDCGPRDTTVLPHWLAIVGCLLTTTTLVLGVSTVVEMLRLWAKQATQPGSWLRIPLTDACWGTYAINSVANSTQVREKSLKCLQYVCRALAYSKLFSAEFTAQAKALSKLTSLARRAFKFLRWVKHFEDLAEANAQKSGVMRGLLFLRVAANFGADWAEDVCSLERLGLLPAGTLSVSFLLFAEFCQLALALVEILVTGVRARKEREVTGKAAAGGADGAKLLKQRRKLALVRLELIKYVSDVGKALYDCELSVAHEGVFIGCSLFSGLMSTHKNMVKIFKDGPRGAVPAEGKGSKGQ